MACQGEENRGCRRHVGSSNLALAIHARHGEKSSAGVGSSSSPLTEGKVLLLRVPPFGGLASENHHHHNEAIASPHSESESYEFPSDP